MGVGIPGFHLRVCIRVEGDLCVVTCVVRTVMFWNVQHFHKGSVSILCLSQNSLCGGSEGLPF